jgi:hypothetical protein
MSRGRHARDGQRRDALRAWLRALLRRPVRAIPRARPGGPPLVATAARSGPGRDTWVIAQPPPGSPLGYQPVTARPGYVVFPDAKVAVTGPGGVTIGGLAPPAPGRAGDTAPMPVLGGRLYAAHQAQRDRAVNQ